MVWWPLHRHVMSFVTHAVTPTPSPGHSPEEARGKLRLCPVSAAMRPCVPVKTVGLSELLQEGGLGGADSEAGGEFPHDGEASHQAAPQGPAEAPSRPLAEQRPFASLHLLLPRPPVTCCGFQGGEGALEKKLRAWWLLSGARDKARAGTRASATWPALLVLLEICVSFFVQSGGFQRSRP